MISAAERIKTNWLLLDDLDMWDEFIIKKNDEKHVKDYYSELEDIINKQLQASVNWLDSPEAKKFFFNEAEYQKKVFESLENEWDKIINGKYDTIDELLEEFYNAGKQKGYTDIKQHIRFTDADKLALTFAKNYNFHLIRKLSNDLRNNVKNKIIKSAIGGENPNKLANELLKLGIKPLPNMTLSAKQRAVMIAKTETSRIQNTGILQSYVNEGYTEVTILTSEDDNVCYTCLRYAYEFNKDSPVVYGNRGDDRTHNIRTLLDKGVYPPFHPNCRCTVLPVWETKGNPPENPFTVNLTPLSFNNHSDEGSSENFIVLTSDKIPNNLPKILHESMLEFDKHIQNAIWEYGYIGNLTANNYGEFVTDENPRKVHLRTSKKVSPLDKLVASHSHLGYMPFNNADFEAALSNINCQFMIVHTNNCVYIAEFESNAFANVDRIIKEVSKSYGEGLIRGKNHDEKVTGKNVWENYKNNNVLNKYMKLVRIEK